MISYTRSWEFALVAFLALIGMSLAIATPALSQGSAGSATKTTPPAGPEPIKQGLKMIMQGSDMMKKAAEMMTKGRISRRPSS